MATVNFVKKTYRNITHSLLYMTSYQWFTIIQKGNYNCWNFDIRKSEHNVHTYHPTSSTKMISSCFFFTKSFLHVMDSIYHFMGQLVIKLVGMNVYSSITLLPITITYVCLESKHMSIYMQFFWHKDVHTRKCIFSTRTYKLQDW